MERMMDQKSRETIARELSETGSGGLTRECKRIQEQILVQPLGAS